MPFGLGFFATAGAGGAAGDYELLETTILGSNASSVTFSSLNSYTAYRHLQIRFVAKKSQSGSFASFHMLRFNGDSGSNYANHYLHYSGSYYDAAAVNESKINYAYVTDGSVGSNSFTAGILDIQDFSVSGKNKTTRTMHGFYDPNAYRVMLHSGVWLNTGAITSLTLSPDSGDYVTGSRFSLYGWK